MSRILNSWLLGAVAIAIVAVSAVVFIMAGMDGSNGDPSSPAAATSGEQRVLFSNLGMT